MPTPKPPYPAQFREQIIELVRTGRRPSELSKEFGCHTTTILSWVRQVGIRPNNGQVASSSELSGDERKELMELRRKLRQVEQERDILAKAMAWFANKSERTFTPSTR